MQEYLKRLKRIGIYLLIVLPIFFGLTYLFSLIDLAMPIAILINVVTGAALCLIFEIIYVNLKKRKQEKQKDKKDLFSE